MIRVLQIPGTLSRLDGRMSVLMNVYRNIDRSKIQFDFVTSTIGEKTYKNEIEELGGKVYVLHSDPSFGDMRKFVDNILKNNNYQYMHYHAISPWGCVLNLGHKYGIKVITHSHATEFSDTFVKSIRNKIFSLNIIKDSDKLVAVSPEAGKKLFGKHSFEYIPTWIDKDKYLFSQEARTTIRSKLGLSDEDILIGHVGRFAIQKNHDFMLKVFKKLVMQDKKYHIAFIGDGPLKEQFMEDVKENHLENNVHFVGVVKNTADYYSAFDIFWLASRYEGLPTVSLEAQANGLMVLASDRITRQIAVGNVEFLPINTNSIDDWVKKTITNAKLRDNNVNQEFINSVFQRSRVLEQWRNLYNTR
ncbi:glycosyltransferase [Ligilactobacillus aviarius]|uniref:glycosyltransferase n=1 Tax=Ligilactobacillus aviarius TaxID=1606 RepID=UPI0025A3D77E|nr:glycosyltransferase [Ligilactobacillus aviarius]MDM8278690.1 glycosyltransferase [Ligilactobacillus aviarius]